MDLDEVVQAYTKRVTQILEARNKLFDEEFKKLSAIEKKRLNDILQTFQDAGKNQENH